MLVSKPRRNLPCKPDCSLSQELKSAINSEVNRLSRRNNSTNCKTICTSVRVVLVVSSPSPKSDPLGCENQDSDLKKQLSSNIYLILKCMEGPANSRAQGKSRLRLMESLGSMK